MLCIVGAGVRRFKTRLVEALGKRERAEELQERYPRRWRCSEHSIRLKVFTEKRETSLPTTAGSSLGE